MTSQEQEMVRAPKRNYDMTALWDVMRLAGVPVWWKGRLINAVRYRTILANLGPGEKT